MVKLSKNCWVQEGGGADDSYVIFCQRGSFHELSKNRLRKYVNGLNRKN